MTSTALRDAAERRAEAFDRDPSLRDAFPGTRQRTLSTGRMVQHARSTGLVLPRRLERAKKVDHNGKPHFEVSGYYTVYEAPYEMWDWLGPYTEIVSAGAGDATTAANPDVVFLVNHKGLAMARTINGGVVLSSDDTGGHQRSWLNPKRVDVADLVEAIDDGVITEQSFAFRIDRGHWSPDYTEYRIDQYDINRGDVSGVNYGANPSTDIEARTVEILETLDQLSVHAAREALSRLQSRSDLAQMTPAAPPEPTPMPVAEREAPVQTEPAARGGMLLSEVDAWLAKVAAGQR